ncbi:MAG: hypothetical protein JKX70_12150 [Phycisphaerales bacterium]|nr:hypothetical protein [Phycisphaerales bacterium]
MNERECDQCGYDLQGLPEGSKCPECGTPIRKRSTRTSGTMSVEAPTRFIRKLRIGFRFASLGIVANLFLAQFGLMFVSSLFWVGGVWLTTLVRPNRGQIRADKVLDNDRFRYIVRAVSAAWPIYGLVALGLAFVSSSANPSALLTVPLIILLVASGAIAWIGLIPTCIYFAELGYWASHDHLAQRLRSTAWLMAVFGVLSVLLTSIAAMGIAPSGAAGFASIFTIVPVIFAVVVFFFTVLQLGSVMSWVIKHQCLAAGSSERVRERIERDINSGGTIVTGLKCRVCKYDLDGLPYGGHCPECGDSYADITPFPILDPANMYKDRDESEIEVELGDNKGIYFNSELDAFGKPKPGGLAYDPEDDGIPEEGDIPLAEDDS